MLSPLCSCISAFIGGEWVCFGVWQIKPQVWSAPSIIPAERPGATHLDCLILPFFFPNAPASFSSVCNDAFCLFILPKLLEWSLLPLFLWQAFQPATKSCWLYLQNISNHPPCYHARLPDMNLLPDFCITNQPPCFPHCPTMVCLHRYFETMNQIMEPEVASCFTWQNKTESLSRPPGAVWSVPALLWFHLLLLFPTPVSCHMALLYFAFLYASSLEPVLAVSPAWTACPQYPSWLPSMLNSFRSNVNPY